MDLAMQPVISAEQVRISAGLQGFISLASLVALVLFFALAAPFEGGPSRWSWLGPVNDWLTVIGAVPWIVATVLLALHLRAGPWLWALSVAASVGAAAIAVVTLLMLSGRVGLDAQAVVSLAATVVAFAWMAAASANAAGQAAVPRWPAVLALAMLIALVVGAALAGIGFAVPAGSPVQTALYVGAGVIGGLAWLAFPAWWLIVAATLA
ncbi:hypothetical protein [Agromyces arachidis]|uniref:hypothetical protein n=1 Tax=Agromyces arachidis TaxID=766966 RepID=UPI0040570650